MYNDCKFYLETVLQSCRVLLEGFICIKTLHKIKLFLKYSDPQITEEEMLTFSSDK